MQLLTYRNAGYPAIAIQTVEEDRLATTLLDTLTANQDDTSPVFSIAATGGLVDLRQQRTIDPNCTYPKAFFEISSKKDQILLVLDFHHVVKNPSAYRSLKLALPRIKANGSFVILVAPSWTLPPELEHEIPVLDFKLPTPEELSRALDVCVNDLRPLNPEIDRMLTPERRHAALQAARGLTLVQAENVFALAAQSAFDRAPIEEEKLKLIRQTGYMQVSPPNPPDAIGGLLGIKDYFETEVIPAKDDPDLAVRGILLVGIPGTGKSLCARTAGAWLQWPVIRLDLGACKGSLVGQTEQNVRKALAIAEAIAPCILWLDEIEKAIGGHASSAATDSGVTLGMVGTLLTWMQEFRGHVLVMATCNDYQKLPAEFTRAGRFDERFFVDLPSEAERVEIASIHLRRYVDQDQAESFAQLLTPLTDRWTGAEIEQCVKSAARRTRKQLTDLALKEAAASIRPLSQTKGPEIEALRQWAHDTLRMANAAPIMIPQSGRRLRHA